MLVRNWFEALKSKLSPAPTRRRRRAPACSLRLEALEVRRLLAFDLGVDYAVGASPRAIVSGDFNNDEILDLATADSASNTVSVLLGNADGTFRSALNSTTGTFPLSLAVGDFNEDGNLDLATANAYDVSVLLGNGNGTFGAATSLGVGSSPTSVAVGDFNADGNLDLGVTSNVYFPGYYGYYGSSPGYHEGRVNVLLGTGSGTFATPIASYLGYGYHTSAAVADFNGDGKDDFATVNVDYGTVSVLLGTATGLGASTNFNTGWYPQAVTVGDFTGDRILDLATAGNTVDILPGFGDGTFRPVVRQYIDPVALAAADFNGDGYLDLVTANNGSTVSALLGAGNGTLRPPIDFATGGTGAVGVAIGDFNRDGRPDVASVNSGSSNVSVLLNDGNWPALNAPSISISDVTVAEGNIGMTEATFTVSLSVASDQAVSVHYATADGSATLADGDYQEKSGTLSFAPGVTSQTVTVRINGDRLAEPSEFFYVHLSNSTNAFVADATGVGGITDDEPHLSIDYGPIYVTEGNTGTTHAEFTVRLSAAYDEPVSVNFSTAEGDTDWWYWGWYDEPSVATSGTDFQAASNTLTFAPGETIKTIPITIYGDRLAELDEYFSVNLSHSTIGTIDSPHAVGIIVNDEPYASINSATLTEGNTGTTAMTFTVTLSAASDAAVTVNYATADGTAVAGSDYQAKTGTVTFGIGETSKTITVLVNGDRLGESDEFFYIHLTGAAGAHFENGTGYGTIFDNEPRLSINSVSVTEGNSGSKLMTFTVTLSAAYDQAVTVNFATHDSSATVADNDYVAKSGTLTFAPGETTKTFTVTIKGDKKKESNEYFYVLLSGVSSNATISEAYGWGTILTDEPAPGKKR